MLTFFGRNSGDGLVSEAAGTVQSVRGYWEALREDGGIPRRADVDPRGMASCLEHVFLLERIAPGQARFRLAGMHLTDLMGMDVRGMPLSALFDPTARTRLAQEVEPVFAQPAIVEFGLEAERGLGRKALAGRMVLLPLRGDAREPGLALGCLVTEGAIGRAPRRFVMTRTLPESLQTSKPEPKAVETAKPPVERASRHPWLRLVSSND